MRRVRWEYREQAQAQAYAHFNVQAEIMNGGKSTAQPQEARQPSLEKLRAMGIKVRGSENGN